MLRKLDFEKLEDGRLLIVGADGPAHVPDDFEYGGIARLDLVRDGGAQSRCSGTLLPSGRHILTAAHCLTGGQSAVNGNEIINESASTVSFFFDPNNTAGIPDLVVGIQSVLANPEYLGTELKELGADIGIIELSEEVDPAIRRYDLYRAIDEVMQSYIRVGYGTIGSGVDGATDSNVPGLKYGGLNRFDIAAETLNQVPSSAFNPFDFPVAPDPDYMPNRYLVSDFDDGMPASDAIGVLGLGSNTGVPNQNPAIPEISDESTPSSGDSGGPLLINGKIAAVTSHGWSIVGADSSPVGYPLVNSSFGELAVDTRVSYYAPWIDSIIDVAGTPRVTNVSISGSTSTHAPYSFDTVDGSGLQLKTVPVGGADRVEVQFSEHVLNIDENSLRLKSLVFAPDPILDEFTYDVGTHVATWTYSQPFGAAQYLISLFDSVTDVAGNALDGEWTNPFSISTSSTAGVSTFPSGNDVAGGDFNFVFTILPGDANLTNWVTGPDWIIYTQNQGRTRTQFHAGGLQWRRLYQ